MSDNYELLAMPNWGMAMEEGTVTRWLVQEGDRVVAGQTVVEIESTKIAGEVESPRAGIMRRMLVEEGDIVAVGVVVAIIADEDVPDAVIDDLATAHRGEARKAGGKSGPPEQRLTLNDGHLAYVSYGDEGAQPIVLLHGLFSNRLTWAGVIDMLAADHRVIAVDLPGHGGSSKSVRTGDVAELGGAVAALIRSLGRNDVRLVAHSLGCPVAAYAAAETQDQIVDLTLIAPLGLSERADTETLTTLLESSRPRKLLESLRSMVADPAIITDAMAQELQQARDVDGAQDSLDRIYGAFFSDTGQKILLEPLLQKAGKPVRVIYGEADVTLGYDRAHSLTPAPTIIAGSAHIPQVEHATTVASLI